MRIVDLLEIFAVLYTSVLQPVSSGSGPGSVLPVPHPAPPFKIGLWRVQSSSHKVTGKRASVWSFGQEVDKLGPQSEECVTEVLKSEVSEDTLMCWLKLKALPTGFRP